MYGVPDAEFRIHGRVTDVEGLGIPDIKIAIKPQDYDHVFGLGLTDEFGNFYVVTHGHPFNEIEVSAIDIDGEANGKWEDETQLVEIDPEDWIDDDDDNSWSRGTVIKKVDFELEPIFEPLWKSSGDEN